MLSFSVCKGCYRSFDTFPFYNVWYLCLIDKPTIVFEVFEKYINNKDVVLTAEELSLIKLRATEKKIRKHHYLLQEDTIWKYNAFVCSGCFRMYTIDAKGEHILRFAFENWWAGDRESYTAGTPSKYNIEALEDTEVLLWTKPDFAFLLEVIPSLKQLMNTLIVNNQIASQSRIHAAISYTVEERYRDFVKRHPGITNRIPLHMIASYLGVTRETLSRIRNQHSKK